MLIAAALFIFTLESRNQLPAKIRTTALVVVSPVYWLSDALTQSITFVSDGVFNYHYIRQELLLKEQELLQLKARLSKVKALEEENKRLNALLGSTVSISEKSLLADIMALQLGQNRFKVVINKGLTDGVYRGQPVINQHGILGQISDVSSTSSHLLLLTDPSHHIPVALNRTGYRCTVRGTGVQDKLALLHIPKTEDVKVGDLLVTTGLGGRFPAGYPVATVSQVRIVPGLEFAEVFAQPTNQWGRTRQVLLIWPTPKERIKHAKKP